MNRRKRGPIPKNTNPTGTRGHGGRNPTLRRPTFVDDIIARVDSSLGSIFFPSNPPRRHIPQSSELPHFETSFSSRAEAKAEYLSPTSQHATLENIEYQSSVARNRENPKETEDIFHINGQIVTKDEWDTFRIDCLRRERAGMENQGDNEEELYHEDPVNNED